MFSKITFTNVDFVFLMTPPLLILTKDVNLYHDEASVDHPQYNILHLPFLAWYSPRGNIFNRREVMDFF